MDRAATDAVPGSSTVTASAAGAPTRPHMPWQLLAGTTTVCGLGRCARPYVLDPRTWLLSPHAPLGCICPSHTPMVPFSAPVSFSPGNPRRLLCLSLPLSHSFSRSLSLSHMEPLTVPFSSTSLTQLGFFLISDLRTLSGKHFLDNIPMLRPYHRQPQWCPCQTEPRRYPLLS